MQNIHTFLFSFEKRFSIFKHSKTCFCYFNQKQGLICCISNRGDEVGMYHFKEIDLGLICWGVAEGDVKWS